MNQTPTDVAAELIAAAKAGDRNAQQELLESQYDFIRRMIYRLAGASADLEDLQQTALLRVVTSLSSFRGKSAFSSWVGGICVNVCKDHWRKKGRAVVRPITDEHPGDQRRHPESDAIANEQLDEVYNALATLSDNHRAVLVLRLAYGHSIKEIAEITNSAKSTTRLRLYYARKAFASAMAKEEG